MRIEGVNECSNGGCSIAINCNRCEAANKESVPFEFHQHAIRHIENNFKQEISRLNAEIAELKRSRFRRFNNEDCWIYQGDGTDNLEALVCPVVIRPDTLKRIIDMTEPDH